MKNYIFTQDWFSGEVENITKTLFPLVGYPVRMIEIGSFEGRSSVWFLDNILTHPQSKLYCIDPFTGNPEHMREHMIFSEIESRFDHNIKESGAGEKVVKIKEYSHIALRKLPIDTFSAVYIDGLHTAPAVMEDAVLSFRLLQKGGFMLFDDYDWPVELPETEKPKLGIDSLLQTYSGQYKILLQDRQVHIQKTV